MRFRQTLRSLGLLRSARASPAAIILQTDMKDVVVAPSPLAAEVGPVIGGGQTDWASVVQKATNAILVLKVGQNRGFCLLGASTIGASGPLASRSWLARFSGGPARTLPQRFPPVAPYLADLRALVCRIECQKPPPDPGIRTKPPSPQVTQTRPFDTEASRSDARARVPGPKPPPTLRRRPARPMPRALWSTRSAASC